MNYKIIVTPFFEKKVKKLKKKYRNIKNDLQDLVKILDANPQAGISLFENIFKIRLRNSDISSKRGGYRVIYYYLDENNEIYLLTIYSKKEQENISKKEILEILKQL